MLLGSKILRLDVNHEEITKLTFRALALNKSEWLMLSVQSRNLSKRVSQDILNRVISKMVWVKL